MDGRWLLIYALWFIALFEGGALLGIWLVSSGNMPAWFLAP